MKVAFIGWAMSAESLPEACCATGADLMVHDLDADLVTDFVARGALDGRDPAAMMHAADVVITCLPSPAASDAVVSSMLPQVAPGKTWMEMSTTDADEVLRLGALSKLLAVARWNAPSLAAAIGPIPAISPSSRAGRGRRWIMSCRS
jgi:3-hydroxyisobutyrate dehydrogenase